MVMISRYASREADNAGCSGGGAQRTPRAPVARIRGGEWGVGGRGRVRSSNSSRCGCDERSEEVPPASTLV